MSLPADSEIDADQQREVAGDAAAVAMSGEWVVEISAAGVNKAAALKELAADLGVEPDEAVAFGDYPNDLSMLEWAGRSIAPVNAHPDVLARVDEVTASNDDDGVRWRSSASSSCTDARGERSTRTRPP